MTDKELELRLSQILKNHDAEICTGCGRTLDRGDIAWNNGSTDFGTGYSTVEIICEGCYTEAAVVHSWYPEISNFEDVINVLESDWQL